jgi:hypothetical protein
VTVLTPCLTLDAERPAGTVLFFSLLPDNYYTEICKNPTHSTTFCQYKIEVEDFQLKRCIDKVYAGLRTSGRNYWKHFGEPRSREGDWEKFGMGEN